MTNQYGEDLFNITSRIRCSSDEGVGGDLYFKTKVGVDSSTESIIDAVGIESAFYNSSVAYGIPTIEYVEVAGIKSPEDLVTQGDTELTITGTNFGPKESLDISVVSMGYGRNNANTGTKYSASDCLVSTGHTKMMCKTVAGVGQDLSLVVTVKDQASDLDAKRFDSCLAYMCW
jgi:hypothetical protein